MHKIKRLKTIKQLKERLFNLIHFYMMDYAEKSLGLKRLLSTLLRIQVVFF